MLFATLELSAGDWKMQDSTENERANQRNKWFKNLMDKPDGLKNLDLDKYAEQIDKK